MGGAVSSGRDNNELIDNLMGGNYIRTRCVERVFRALDRADYMTPESRDQAYKDLAWRNGALHMSSPCIYSEVMEGLELKPGLSFLNVGSGTGYLSTLAGLILGSGGISHGVEVHSSVVDYANKKLGLFMANSPTLDEFDFCEPKFYVGNGLCLTPQQQPYDRVYCGAACPDEYENYFKQLIKVGGVLVMPLNDTLLQVRRVGPEQWVSRSLLTVSFATLRVPPKDQRLDYVKLEDQSPPRLQVMARGAVRAGMRRGVLRRHPDLREPAPRRAPPAACPRRICIPIEPGGAVDGLDILHDLDAETGANEMNALLSLVIRMDQNRVAGAIRFDGVDSSSDTHSHSEGSSDEGRPRRNRADANERRTRPTLEGREDNDRSGEGHSSTRHSKSNGHDSGTSSSDSKSSKNGYKSDRSSDGSESKDRNERKSDRTSSDDGENPSSRRGRRGQDDDKSSRLDKCKRVPPAGRLWAFEFQATERSQQATTSSGAGRSTDISTATSDSGDVNKKQDEDTKSRRESCDCKHSSDIIPSEVEFCFRGSKLQGLLPGPSGARMDWEESRPEGGPEENRQSAGEEPDSSKNKAKRQKLDSGIGENSPSGSSPDKCKTDESDTDERPSDSVTEDADHGTNSNTASRRRVHKRTRCEARASSSSAEEGGAAGAEGAANGGGRRRAPRRGRGVDARRVRLSIVMKRAIKELPLPYPLKKYVNLGRCFEF